MRRADARDRSAALPARAARALSFHSRAARNPPSLGIGIVLMLTHRLYARPWALARARARCLWCGADVAARPRPRPSSSRSRTRWAARAGARAARPTPGPCGPCSRGRRDRGGLPEARDPGKPGRVPRLGRWRGVRLAERAGVRRRRGLLSPRHRRHRCCLSAGSRLAADAVVREAPRAPFPLHVPALIGLRTVLWLFRLVGLRVARPGVAPRGRTGGSSRLNRMSLN